MRIAWVVVGAIYSCVYLCIGGCGGTAPKDEGQTALGLSGTGASFWSNRTPEGSPGGRTAAAVAFDPVRRKAVLYGGFDGSNILNDTWEWDSDSRAWTKILTQQPVTPPALRDHRMAYFDGAIVLYGGLRGDNAMANGNVWRYTPGTFATWSRVQTGGGGPSARWGHGMAVVPNVGLLIEGGMSTTTVFNDSWLLASLTASWDDFSDTSRRPTPRSGQAMYWDDTSGELVLFGGTLARGDAGVGLPTDDTWTGAVGNSKVVWTLLGNGQPGARADSPAVFYPTFGRGVLFSDGTTADTWLFGPTAWSPDSPTGAPPPRTGQAMTYDGARGVVLLFGGSPTRADTWEYRIDAVPSIALPATVAGTEAQPVSFDVVASDTVDTAETLALDLYSMTPAPPSAPSLARLFPAANVVGQATGSFSWTPGCKDHGAYHLVFEVSDGVNRATAETQLTIANADCPPEWNPVTPPAFTAGKSGGFVVSAIDPDGDAVTYSMDPVTAPRTPSVAPGFDSASGTFTWTPGSGDTGTFSVTFHALAAGADVPLTVMVTVTNSNLPPALTLPPPQDFVEGTTGSFTVSATDPDGDPVTLGFSGIAPAPAVAPSFDAESGLFSWKPGFLDAGTYLATFSAADASHPPVTGTVTIVVGNTNRPPALAVSPTGTRKTVTEGSTLVFTVTASDLDTDDTLALEHGSLPANAVASGTGTSQRITFTPDLTQGSAAGTVYPFTFTASDGHTTTTLTINVTVLDMNRPPVITPIAPQTVAEGHALAFTVSATDPDGQPLVYSALVLPAGATFDPTTHLFRWTPGCDAADDGGQTSARFAVSDGVDTATVDVAIAVTGTVVLLTPSSLSFPTTRVGVAAAPIGLTVHNGSAAAGFTVLSVAVSDPAFSVAAPTLPAPLDAGADLAVMVGFRPAEASSFAGTVTVTIDDPICGTSTVPVVGVGQNAGVQVSRSGADFGQVRVGTTSAAADFTVTNAGDVTFTVTGVTLTEVADFALTLVKPTASGYPATLAPGQTVTFSVAARPTVLGLLSGQVAIATDLAAGAQTLLPLAVVGVAPGLAVSESRIDFGPVDIRSAGAMHELDLTNYGTTTLTVGQPVVTGPGAGAYDIVGIGTSGLVLEPGRSASVVILFQPTVESKEQATAAVQLTSDAPDQPSIIVPLTGRGADRHLVVAPAQVTFEAAGIGAPVTKGLVLTNGGEAPLIFGTPAATTAAPFAVTGVPARLAGGASATATVTFTPTSAGDAGGDLALASDDPDHPSLHVPLSGKGMSRDLAATPPALDVGVVPVGSERPLPELVVTNSAATASHSITMLCVAATATSGCGGTDLFHAAWSGPVTIGAGGRASLAVTFAPRATGTATAMLLLYSDGGSEPSLTVSLAGEGVDDVRLSGGGCSVAGDGSSGAAAVLVVVLLLAARRRHPWAAILILSAAAHADGSFDLAVFRPTTVPGSALVTVELPEVLPANAIGLAATFDYAKNPLYALRPGTRDMPVSDRGSGTLTIAYGILGPAEVAASLPIVVASGSAQMTGVAAASGTGVGDIGLEGRLVLVPGLLAGSVLISLPTGDGDRYNGAGGVAGELRAVTGTQVGPVRLAADAGLRLRGEAQLGPVAQGNAITFGAGAAMRLAGQVEALGELYGAIGLTGDVGAASPVEGILGLRVRTSGVVLTAGAGAGLQSGVGAADLRLFAGLAFVVGGSTASLRPPAPTSEEVLGPSGPAVPPAPDADRDHDGIPDRLDRCPDEPEDKDGWEDDDGCPDLDNDKDGIPDDIDKCPNEPETINGVDDDDGCPDKGDPAVLLLSDRIELLLPLKFQGAALRPAAASIVGQIAATLRAHPEIARLTIAVHVEPTRYPDKDRQLAEKRAAALRAALEVKGVPPAHLDVDPVGSARPLKKGLSERVELLIH